MTARADPDVIDFEELEWERFSRLPAEQQPEWPDREELRTNLRALPKHDLVTRESVDELRRELAGLDAAGGLILQIGDCVEDIDGEVSADTRKKLFFFERAREHLSDRTGRDVLTVGRIAGQYAKPRSQEHETVGGAPIPSYRGPIVNAPWPTEQARRPSPARIAYAHAAAQVSYQVLADHRRAGAGNRPIWASHEMLLLDYELRFLRRGGPGNHLATTHWPWIGARTNRIDGAHIAVAATLNNPVSVKLGPATAPEEAAGLAAVLNPGDEPGRLTFIARMGHRGIDALRPIVRAVHRRVEHVNWISDPMHGNTVKAAGGLKTRHVEHIAAELRSFQEILAEEGRRPAGLHLEATPDDVYECAEDSREPEDRTRYRTLLDPRLNPEQTTRVLDQWSA
ncbi:3-deoxy-7-phosphoheptulonate synthase [Nocardiopsis composta]|uniref:Phospho-2-dehydro-3-deoxyheptonate aldolase n=1 Tax=Nocardiopsis composta TaxID=157465 RepID=A0A7W8QGS9_9ACTN|nr:3-deoxy-7-phosphoheptulonate synthase [Nocardiopsis composta]MBB5430187.1 3-deoxy-7-phosphoheptulonate synthase [Nocardiopsis composta]